MDEKVQQLLKETYEQVKPSPEFKQRLFQQLVRERQSRRPIAGWRQRVRSLLAGPSLLRRPWPHREAISVILALVLLVLVVGGTVWAIRGRSGNLPPTAVAPERQAPDTLRTPTAQPATFTPTASQPAGSQPLPKVPSEQVFPTVRPETPLVQPSDLPPPLQLEIATPTLLLTATVLPSATSTLRPATATFAPTPAEVANTATPEPTAAKITALPPTVTLTPCAGARIAGVAWVDVNGDSRRGEGDLPLGGVTLMLLDKTGQLVSKVTTDADGRYGFDNLSAGIYSLHAVPPSGYQPITSQTWGMDLICATVAMDLGYQAEEE